MTLDDQIAALDADIAKHNAALRSLSEARRELLLQKVGIRTGDRVKALRGRFKGAEGVVESVRLWSDGNSKPWVSAKMTLKSGELSLQAWPLYTDWEKVPSE